VALLAAANGAPACIKVIVPTTALFRVAQLALVDADEDITAIQ
jgi:hypothetical protein